MITSALRPVVPVFARFDWGRQPRPGLIPITLARMLSRKLLRMLLSMLAASTLAGSLACHDLSGLAGSQTLPAGTPDPSVYRNPAGALALYQTTLAAFQYRNGVSTASIGSVATTTTNGAFVDFMFASGLLTDELQSGDFGCSNNCVANDNDKLDSRTLPSGITSLVGTSVLYQELQNVRNDATLGIGALAAYDTAASPALRGHLYAMTGYAELLLADLFCSGVPLSTLNFNSKSSFTYAPSSTTVQVYQAALSQFDTAVALSGDSARVLNLAWVGKARALLALDSLPQAAAAAARVPDGFSYQFLVDWSGGSTTGGTLFQQNDFYPAGYTVADQEGGTGLLYRSSGDLRTIVEEIGTNANGIPQYIPLKYGGATPSVLPITVADWIEARLIRAEAALRAKDYSTWLVQLNTLRETARVPGQTSALADTTDPGDSPNDSARVALTFHERAYWLFLTGHRQGDLRRLLRQYGTIYKSQAQVYPTGSYLIPQIGFYGTDIDVPIPFGSNAIGSESPNPYFHGCLARGS